MSCMIKSWIARFAEGFQRDYDMMSLMNDEIPWLRRLLAMDICSLVDEEPKSEALC